MSEPIRHIKLGDTITYQMGDETWTGQVTSVEYHGAAPAIYKHLNRWQRMARWLTPPSRRKSLLIRPATPATITINGGESDSGRQS